MTKQYLNILIESLEKKERILQKIIVQNEEQALLLKQEMFDVQAFDKTVEEKGKLIDTLAPLDDGFESIYEHIHEELASEAGKKKYAAEILRMQELIRCITDKSMTIQAGEQRNKQGVESFFRKEREQIKSGRTNSKAAMNYYRNMKKMNYVPPHFLDSKK